MGARRVMPYRFKPEDAERFAAERGIPTRHRGDELLFASCPYCGKKEGGFAISLRTGAFNCMRAKCGAKGNMLTLHKDFGFDLGGDVREYEKPLDSWRRFKRPEKITPTNPAVAYLKSRGIPEEITQKYEVTTKRGADNILVFPFENPAGEIEFIKYRKTDFDKTRDKNKEWSEAGMRPILFGMRQCVDFERLVLTEGQIDSLSVAAAGIKNACSVPNGKNGMTWVPHNWDWLCKFSAIVIFGDFERGSMTLLDDVRERFNCRILAVREEDYRGCKDANELLQKYGEDAVRKAVESAAPVMLPQVVELADVTYAEGTGSERLSTGLALLDDALDGGLAFGYLDILTGKRGDGKSTLGSMILKSALEQDYNCFVYSGELLTGDVRLWLDRQIAGRDRVTVEWEEHAGKRRYPRYSVSRKNAQRIGDWYRGRAFLYSRQTLEGKKTPLEEIVETYIRQFGCRFVLIDNLMTAIEITGSAGTKFERQEQTAKRLAELARKYNALILLVAHKKKTNPNFPADENDDVLGSSEITNLAGVVFNYERPRDQEKQNERIVKITKNRLSGHLELKGIPCWFDEPSKRIGTEPDDRDAISKPFLAMQEGFEEVTDGLTIPF